MKVTFEGTPEELQPFLNAAEMFGLLKEWAEDSPYCNCGAVDECKTCLPARSRKLIAKIEG